MFWRQCSWVVRALDWDLDLQFLHLILTSCHFTAQSCSFSIDNKGKAFPCKTLWDQYVRRAIQTSFYQPFALGCSSIVVTASWGIISWSADQKCQGWEASTASIILKEKCVYGSTAWIFISLGRKTIHMHSCESNSTVNNVIRGEQEGHPH